MLYEDRKGVILFWSSMHGVLGRKRQFSVQFLPTVCLPYALGVKLQTPCNEGLGSTSSPGLPLPIWQTSCLIQYMTIDEREWRKLCESIQNEQDPLRLSKLVDQLLNAMDERREVLQERKEVESDA